LDRRDNPYTPGAGRKPSFLAGRDQEIDDFRGLVERLSNRAYERSMIFSGLRGTGKTVLLLEFDAIAHEAGWASTGVREVGSQGDFRRSFARMAARLLHTMSFKARVRDRATRALSVVKSFSAAGPGGVGIKLEVEPSSGTADSGDIEEDLAELVEEIGKVAQADGSGALFLIDEMQNLDAAALGAICIAFHRLSQQALPVALVGAGLPILPTQLYAAKPYAGRLFTYHDIGRLPAAAARSALITPASRRGVKYDDHAVELIIGETGGYPYFIQEYGRVLWFEAAGTPITANDVKLTRELVIDSLDEDFFGPQFTLATDAEQRYLLAMAELGDGPYRSSDVATKAGHKNVQGASLQRHGLMKKELIWSPKRGEIDFTVPRFAQYLRDRHLDIKSAPIGVNS
jgi:hypothetical protein